MALETILCETSEEVLAVTLNRPEKLNAYTLDMARELGGADPPRDVGDARRRPSDGGPQDSRGMFARGASADVREGVTPFLEKRAPNFSNRVSHDMPAFFQWARERRYQ